MVLRAYTGATATCKVILRAIVMLIVKVIVTVVAGSVVSRQL